jgi:serine/threonine-protein kinase
LDQPTAAELAGTEGAVAPFFSPDGQWVAFLSGDKVNKMSVEGGAVVPVASPPGFTGASWSEDGNILVGGPMGIVRIPSGGGPPVTLMERGNGELADAVPMTQPGGKAVLFTSFPM